MTDTYFDRRVAGPVFKQLAPGGFADSLVEFGRSGQYCLDLQLRHSPKSKEYWATLYVGTTKVLDLKFGKRSRHFHLEANATCALPKHGWDPEWRRPRTASAWTADWANVETYLESVIATGVKPGYSKEGRIQSALSLYPAADMVVIDRETVVGYTDTATRARILKQYLDPLMEKMRDAGNERWWKPKAPGNECDGIAISADGGLLAIEVKPANVQGLVWAPLQAIHYANLLQHWADETPKAAEVLQGMYEQRRELGLIRDPGFTPQLIDPVVVRPVVAVGGTLSEVWRDRLALVAARLDETGIGRPEFRRVNLVGRMDPLPLP